MVKARGEGAELPNELLVAAWMNQPDHQVAPTTTLEDAFAVMQRENVRHLLVVDGGDLVGIVSDRDLRRQETPRRKSSKEPWTLHDLYLFGDELAVRDVMTEDVVTVSPDDPTSTAARVMVENKINCLPVVLGGDLVGILTSSDLLAALVYSSDPDEREARELED
ncbi:MAG: CBS domain-containing protein [Polyangiaceae bacterium]|nr:CBS domain-containing protein [Polyangiaceae bacterium]